MIFYLGSVLKIFNQVTGSRTKAFPTLILKPPEQPIQAMSQTAITQIPILEIACFNQESAMVAARAGADRIE